MAHESTESFDESQGLGKSYREIANQIGLDELLKTGHEDFMQEVYQEWAEERRTKQLDEALMRKYELRPEVIDKIVNHAVPKIITRYDKTGGSQEIVLVSPRITVIHEGKAEEKEWEIPIGELRSGLCVPAVCFSEAQAEVIATQAKQLQRHEANSSWIF